MNPASAVTQTTKAGGRRDPIEKLLDGVIKAAKIQASPEVQSAVKKALRGKAEQAAEAAIKATVTPKMAMSVYVEELQKEAADAKAKLDKMA